MDPTPNVPHAPAASHAAIPQAKPTRRAAKRGRLFYLGVAGLILGAGCCLLSVVALVVAASMKFKTPPAGSTVPENPPAVSSRTAAIIPTEIQTRLSSTSGFATDFSNSNDGWNVVSTYSMLSQYDPLSFHEIGGMGGKGIIKANHNDRAGQVRCA